MVRLLEQMDDQTQDRERPLGRMVAFPTPSSTMIRHEWNRPAYRVKADGCSLGVHPNTTPVTGPGLVYLTPGGGEITATQEALSPIGAVTILRVPRQETCEVIA